MTSVLNRTMKHQELLVLVLALVGYVQGHGQEKDEKSSDATTETAEFRVERQPADDPRQVQYAPLVYPPYPIFAGGMPIPLVPVSPENRNLGVSAGLNLGPFGAGFGAGLKPNRLFFGAGGGYSGNLHHPYNYQQYQAPYHLYGRSHGYFV